MIWRLRNARDDLVWNAQRWFWRHRKHEHRWVESCISMTLMEYTSSVLVSDTGVPLGPVQRHGSVVEEIPPDFYCELCYRLKEGA